MRERDDIETIKARLSDPPEVARLLGLDRRTQRQGNGLLVCCPAHGDDTPSCSLTRGPDGTLRVRCFGCELAGDILDLVAAVERLDRDRDFRRVLEHAAALAGVHLDDRHEPRQLPPRPPPPPPPPPKRPPPDELRALLSACIPCRADAEVCAWLRSRGLDPDLVDLYGLALALPASARLPWWAGAKLGRDRAVPWTEDGYRLILPMRDATGRVVSVRARAVRPTEKNMPKALPATGSNSIGLVMADHRASLMLASGTWTAGADRRVVIAEGEPDWLTCASAWNSDEAFRLAVLGLGGKGQWTAALADRIPDGSTVIVWTDQDDAGDAYAVEVAATLGGRCEVLESYPEARAERRRTLPERERARREAERARRAEERNA